MKRLAGLTVLLLVALPVAASNPNRIKKERTRPVQTAEPPLARPIPAQPAAPPVLNDRVVRTALCPHRLLANLVLRGYDSDFHYWRLVLSGTSRDLAEARVEFHQFWMGNQPSVLTYERVNGAIGP